MLSLVVQDVEDDLTGDPSDNLGGLSEGLGALTGECSVIREMRADTRDFLGVFGVDDNSIEALRRLPRLFVKVIVGLSVVVVVYSRDRDLSIGSIVRWIEGVLHKKYLPDVICLNLEIGDSIEK